MTATAPRCERLEWDSRFFGRSIARVFDTRLDDAGARAVLEWCREERVECLYLLAAPDDPPTLRALERSGFQLVDIRVTLELTLTGGRGQGPAGTRDARPSDIPALKEIAGTCHRNTRFYLDGHFDRDRCDEMYRIWIERSCAGTAEHVIVAERDGGPVGYLTVGGLSPERATIGLVGVGLRHQRQGVGADLVRAGLAWLAGRMAGRVSVVTQGHNIASQSLYQREGFRTSSVMLWYHRWFQEHVPSR